VSLFYVYLRALLYLRPEIHRVSAVCLANVALAGLAIAEPVLFGQVIEAMANGSDLQLSLSVWAAAGLVNIMAFVIVAREADRLAHRLRVDVLTRAFEQIIAMPLAWHQARGSSQTLHTLLRAVDTLFGLWLEFMRQHLSTAVALLLLLPTALVLDFRLTLVLVALGASYVLISRFVMNRTRDGQRAVERYHHGVFAHVSDTISNVTILQSYNRVRQEAASLRQQTARLLDAQYPVLDWWAIASALHRMAAALCMIVVLSVGAFLVNANEIRVGEIVAFTGFAGLMIARLDQVIAFINQIFEARVKLDEFYAMEREAVERPQDHDRPELGHVHGHVRFENVSFSFPHSRQGVHDVSFEVAAGKTVAIVGPTGSGKSTLINLLQRVYEPDCGRILIDGQDIAEVSLASLRRAVATVFQDAGLLNRSISDNIRIGREDAEDEQIAQAARIAEAHGFVLSKPQGYETVVGERGAQLSGGERQRIAIARAVLKDAPILVLDEATSALDVETEARLKNAIDTLRRDRTTFIIAHRLSTVRDADLVIVLDHGRIVEMGSYDELVLHGGRFHALLRAGGLLDELGRARPHLLSLPDEVAA
jgi:ATP-binding cassette subfamily B protein